MSAAFAACGHTVTLHAKHGRVADDIHALYGTSGTFSLALHKNLPIPKLGVMTYALAAAFACRFGKTLPQLAYGRDPFSILAAAMLGVPVALELHSIPEKPMWIQAIHALLRSSRMNGLVTITRSLRDDVALMFFQDSDSILVAPDAADDPYAGSLPPPSPAAGSPMRVGYVGSLYRGRGIELILALAERCPGMEFVIVGGQDHELEALRRKSNTANVRHVSYVPHAQLGSYYKDFDVMLAPYERAVAVAGNRGDTSKHMSPMKIFEYMSYGKPIVATKHDVLQEIQELETFCFSSELEDIEQWVACLNTLAHDPALRARMGRQAYSVFLRHYTWKTRADNILEWLKHRACKA